MNVYDVIIIGGGLSGLSAAVNLSANGIKVLLLEQHRYCGGRTYSFVDTMTGECVDNGQHLMLGCYQATRNFLHTIGTEHLVSLQPAISIKFLSSPNGRLQYFSCPDLPSPLHLINGLLRFKAIPIRDRFAMLKVAKELISTSKIKESALDRLTAEEWLVKLDQSDLSRKYLWNVITLGALNNHPADVSALMLFRVLRTAFIGNQKNSSLLIPRVGLNELFIDPAVKFIESHGGKVKTSVKVDSFRCEREKIFSVKTRNNKELIANSFISAIPWYAFERIMSANSSEYNNGLEKSRFFSSPIISIHLWLDSEITDLDFAALINTRIQWLFNKSKMINCEKRKIGIARQYISLVISGAREFVGLTNELLVKMAMEDLRDVLPHAKKANVVRSLIIKEKRATFSPSPGLEIYRPKVNTEFKNLFLAGDWTATGYPATIEGAVLSGVKAAKQFV